LCQFLTAPAFTCYATSRVETSQTTTAATAAAVAAAVTTAAEGHDDMFNLHDARAADIEWR